MSEPWRYPRNPEPGPTAACSACGEEHGLLIPLPWHMRQGPGVEFRCPKHCPPEVLKAHYGQVKRGRTRADEEGRRG